MKTAFPEYFFGVVVLTLAHGEEPSKGFSLDEPLPAPIEIVFRGDPDLVGAWPDDFSETGELSFYIQDYIRSNPFQITHGVVEESGLSAKLTAQELRPYNGNSDDSQDFFLFLFDGSATMDLGSGDPMIRRRTMAQCLIERLIAFPVEIPFPVDQIALMQWFRPNEQFAFNELLHDFSDNKQSLKSALSKLGSEGVTPLHEAVIEALMYLAVRTPAHARRTLIMFSDGLDNQEFEEQPVIDAARELGIQIWAFGYNESIPDPPPTGRPIELNIDLGQEWGRHFPVLSSLTRQTGGRFFKGNRDATPCPPSTCPPLPETYIWCDVVGPYLFRGSARIDLSLQPQLPLDAIVNVPIRTNIGEFTLPVNMPVRSETDPQMRDPLDLIPSPLEGQTIRSFGRLLEENADEFYPFVAEPITQLNSSTLAGVDVLVMQLHQLLGSGEIEALEEFVETGGGVIAFTERHTFPATLNQVTELFGLTGVGGDRSEVTTIQMPDHPVVNGPFGIVDNGVNAYRPQLPGAFNINQIPANADVVATTADGHAAIVALEASRALPVCSGNVVLFNDVNFFEGQRLYIRGNEALLLNALNFVKRPLDAIPHVTVEQAAGQPDPAFELPIVFDVRFTVTGAGFDESDVRFLGDARVLDFDVVGSGTTYQILVNDVEGDGEVMPMVLAGAVTNPTQRCFFPSEPSTSVDNRVFFDGTPPIATFTQAPGQADPTNQLPIRFDVQFTEPVVGFDGDDSDDVDVMFGGTAEVSAYRVVPKKFDHLVNGGFETGTFEGWQVAQQAGSAGDFFIGDGTAISPIEMHETAGPASGDFYALTDQNGATALALTQPLEIAVEPRLRTFLEFELFVDSWGTTNLPVFGGGLDYTVGKNQYATVDILTGGANPLSTSAGDVLQNLYRRVDPTISPNPYSAYRFDITDAVNAGNGDVQFRVGMVANQAINGFGTRDFFNLGADNIRIYSEQHDNTTDFTIEITEVAFPGTVTVTIPAGRARDLVGNSTQIAPGGDQVALYDIDPPQMTISDPSVTSTLSGPAHYTVSYTDAASVSLMAEDVSLLTSGSVTASVAVSSIDTFTRRVTLENMAGNGTVRIAVGAGTARDVAGNLAEGATATAAVRVGVSGGSEVLTVDPPTLNFGELIVGTSTDRTVMVQSEADDPMTVRVETSAPFSVVTQSQFTLAPGESRMVAIRFSPATTGVFTQQARMFSGQVDLASVALSGSGAPAGAAPLRLSPADADVGFVQAGETATAEFRLLNRGTTTLNGTLSIGAPFSIVGSTAFGLDSGQSRIVQVRFAPNQVADYVEKLTAISGLHEVSADIAGSGVSGLGGIEGEISDRTAKAPITCAAVGAFSGDDVLGLALATESGRYLFPALPAGVVTLRVWAPGFQTVETNIAVMADTVRKQNFELAAGSPARTISGQVVSSGNESGLSGVRVEVLQNGVVVAVTYTCAGGTYEVAGLPQGEYQVRFRSNDFQTSTNPADLNLQTNVMVDGTLLRDAAAAGRLMGEVREADSDDPIANVHVLIGKGTLFFRETTGADGAFNATSLPPGYYTVIAAAEGFEAAHAHISVFDGEPAADVELALEALPALPPEEPNGCGAAGQGGRRNARGDVMVVIWLGLMLLWRRRARRGLLEG